MARLRTVKAKSVEQEDFLAKLFGGRRSRTSGAADNDKGDVFTDFNLIEAKYTEAASIRIKLGDWQKIHHEAYGRGRRPAMGLRFRTPDKNTDLIVLSVHDYAEILEEYLARRGGGEV